MRTFYYVFLLIVFFGSGFQSISIYAQCPTFEIKEADMRAEGCEERQGCTSVKLRYPLLSSGAFMDEINTDILKTVAQGLSDGENEGEEKSIDELTAAFFKSYSSFIEEFPETSYEWEKEVGCSVLRLSSKVLSLQYSIYSFTGGAHPVWFTYYYNYDLTTGKVIKLGDMLEPADKAKLDEAVGLAFKKMKGIDAEVDLTELLRGYVDKFEANDNFLLKDDGVVFYYNSYEIAPYSEGPSKVFVSYADIPYFTKM